MKCPRQTSIRKNNVHFKTHAENMNSLILYGQTSAELLVFLNYGILKATIISVFLRIWGI